MTYIIIISSGFQCSEGFSYFWKRDVRKLRYNMFTCPFKMKTFIKRNPGIGHCYGRMDV